jgi:hypothetical protein
MLERAPILILASSEAEGREIHQSLALDDGESLISTPEDADLFITSSRLGGMIVGGSCHPNAAKPLVGAYIQHQPCGRIAILVAEDVTTLAVYIFLGQRVEAFFTPWRSPEVREFLGIRVATPVEAAG